MPRSGRSGGRSSDGPTPSALGRLLLLTGQRRGEIAGLRWADLDLEAGVLRLAGTATKTGTEHVLPLKRAAVEILRDAAPDATLAAGIPGEQARQRQPGERLQQGAATAHRLSGTTGWHLARPAPDRRHPHGPDERGAARGREDS